MSDGFCTATLLAVPSISQSVSPIGRCTISVLRLSPFIVQVIRRGIESVLSDPISRIYFNTPFPRSNSHCENRKGQLRGEHTQRRSPVPNGFEAGM